MKRTTVKSPRQRSGALEGCQAQDEAERRGSRRKYCTQSGEQQVGVSNPDAYLLVADGGKATQTDDPSACSSDPRGHSFGADPVFREQQEGDQQAGDQHSPLTPISYLCTGGLSFGGRIESKAAAARVADLRERLVQSGGTGHAVKALRYELQLQEGRMALQRLDAEVQSSAAQRGLAQLWLENLDPQQAEAARQILRGAVADAVLQAEACVQSSWEAAWAEQKRQLRWERSRARVLGDRMRSARALGTSIAHQRKAGKGGATRSSATYWNSPSTQSGEGRNYRIKRDEPVYTVSGGG